MAVVSTPDIPPHDLNNERAALGCVLLDPRTLSSLQDTLAATDFYSPAHRMIYSAMNMLSDDDEPIDPTTLANRLRRNGELESIGGLSYIATLEDYVFTTENVTQYAHAILDASRLRQLLDTTDKIRHEALSSPLSVGEILDRAEKNLFDLTQHSESREFTHVEKVAEETIDEINKRFLNRHQLTGLPTGFKLLDLLLTGLHPTDLIILAARPSMGKTALALNIAANVVLKKSVPVGFFSLEMSRQQLVQRILCSMASVSMQKVRSSSLGRMDLEKLDEAARVLTNAPLYIDDTSHLNILEVRSKARRLKARVKDLGLIVLDYLQLMAGHGKSENRQQEVAEISRSLKSLGRELNVPVIALSQLRREAEDRKGKDKEPKLSDLRESGAIEQDADVVLFVHRDKKAEIDLNGQQQAGQSIVQPAEVIIGKQRNGPLGTVPLLFQSEFTRFVNVSQDVL